MLNRKQLFISLIITSLAIPSWAQDQEDAQRASDSVAMNFIGDTFMLGLGYGNNNEFHGELKWLLTESSDSAFVGEGWVSDGAGGLKINYHWLTDKSEAGVGPDGQPVYKDGRVRKFFLAVDRNEHHDGKISFGTGSEREDQFWSLYASRSITSERYVGQTVDFSQTTFSGIMNNHAWTRTDSWETITDIWEHPYEWGIGFRIGHFWDSDMVRIRGGLDYENGRAGSLQRSAYASLNKRFKGTSHGFTLRAEVMHKEGDFEVDQNDVRFSALWNWDFGNSYRPAEVYRQVQVERMPDVSELPREQVTKVVNNKVTMDNMASFKLNSANLGSAAQNTLAEFIAAMQKADIISDINIIGHTCSLGTDEYNQGLSERRARTVNDFLVNHGVDASGVSWEGRGEKEPRYSNDTEESRSRNRRVEISFTAAEEVMHEIIVGEGQPIKEWVQEAVPVEAAWIRRALRNPAGHKRNVDVYRINRVTENHETGETIIENSGPTAVDDNYPIIQNTSDNALSVLNNDSDPEDDDLTIIEVTSPLHGSAYIDGNVIRYTPMHDYFGSDSFSYTIDDGYGDQDQASVTINISRLNVDPIAADDNYEVESGSSDNVLPVLENDTDEDGNTLTISSTTLPTNGTVVINGDVILYTPAAEFIGADQFSYTINDGFGGEDTAEVTITIRQPNNPPVATFDRAQTAKETAFTIDVLANDYDPDGDPIEVISIRYPESRKGTVSINGDGTVTYTRMPGWWGGDRFFYTISDGRGGTDEAGVILTVYR